MVIELNKLARQLIRAFELNLVNSKTYFENWFYMHYNFSIYSELSQKSLSFNHRIYLSICDIRRLMYLPFSNNCHYKTIHNVPTMDFVSPTKLKG